MAQKRLGRLVFKSFEICQERRGYGAKRMVWECVSVLREGLLHEKAGQWFDRLCEIG
ncbi:MAG: hypothetical protein JWM99_4568 [Verrucomicrobiales bacterium]|nr:hypothetical protein [Verrucomicrobiales bacterium]